MVIFLNHLFPSSSPRERKNGDDKMQPIQALNRDNINKRASVGLVIINGGVNTTLVSKARSNPKARFANVGGQNGAKHGLVDEMDLVWTEKSTHNHIHMHNRQDTGLNGNHHKVFCLSRLNGQGFKDQSNEEFMQTIKVLGFCDRSNDSNSRGLFPIVAGGIKTGLNIGNWTFHTGDRVMWHAMSDEELKINRGNGKADSVGDIKLVLKPYFPDKNSVTVRPMYRCLRRKQNGDQGHTQSYIETCDGVMDAVRKLAIPVVYAVLDKIPMLRGRGIDKRQFAKELFDVVKSEDNFEAIENAVFAAHAPIEKGVDHFIEPVTGTELHKAQAEALDKLLLCLATHLDTIVSRIMGTVLNESKPQENYDILINKYDV